jgi:hypothetical protein
MRNSNSFEIVSLQHLDHVTGGFNAGSLAKTAIGVTGGAVNVPRKNLDHVTGGFNAGSLAKDIAIVGVTGGAVNEVWSQKHPKQ